MFSVFVEQLSFAVSPLSALELMYRCRSQDSDLNFGLAMLYFSRYVGISGRAGA